MRQQKKGDGWARDTCLLMTSLSIDFLRHLYLHQTAKLYWWLEQQSPSEIFYIINWCEQFKKWRKCRQSDAKMDKKFSTMPKKGGGSKEWRKSNPSWTWKIITLLLSAWMMQDIQASGELRILGGKKSSAGVFSMCKLSFSRNSNHRAERMDY